MLLAPWTSFDTEGWESVKYNKNKDTVSPVSADLWSSNFLGGKPRDQYNEPITAEAEWWRDLKAEEVLIVCGGNEILLDSIKAFGGKLKVSDAFVPSILPTPEFSYYLPLKDILYNLLLFVMDYLVIT